MRARIMTATSAILAMATGAIAKEPQPDFELIRYKLPEAGVAARLSLTLEECSAQTVRVSGEARLAAEAGASDESFALTSRQLESARIKRSLDIALHDTGAIATIDSAVEDRTGAIIGNVIRFVAGVAGAFLGLRAPAAAPSLHGPKPPPPPCGKGVLAALERVRAIEATLAEWRSAALPTDPAEAGAQSRAIDRLAAERAALRVGILHVELETELDLTPPAGTAGSSWTAASAFDLKPLAAAWLATGAALPAISARWSVALPSGAAVPAAGQQPAPLCRARLDALGGQAICFVTPARASFKASFAGTGITLSGGALEAKGSFPVPQWGALRVLGLSAGFGSNRQVSLTLDKFGQASGSKWTSAARAENATAALAGISEQVSGIVAANGRTAGQKDEIDALQTQQTLNRLRACRDILEAGGSACPAEAPTKTEE